jgi:hypothetical protein
MTPTNEQIVEEAERRARAARAKRSPPNWSVTDYVIEVVREGWKPPLDPDLIAVQKALRETHPESVAAWGNQTSLWTAAYAAEAILAAYKAGREAEAERARVLVETLEALNEHYDIQVRKEASNALAAYKAGKTAQ